MTTLTIPGKADIRAGAADLLKTGGWIQGKYYSTRSKTPGVCLVAAISLAAGLPAVALASLKPHSKDADYLARWEVAQELCSEIATALGRPAHEMAPTRWLSFWNDKPHTTLAQVRDALEGQAA
ncbi:DUF6197 family protein [Nonomuraea basaltis]|uniref:DUF6197 family protein n=1 Tax=Nonomuraea basaltis TaxID=2495887 RepID=UPI00110C635F|nr:hypothetical protein [Nonomuraea basaltis]TMR99555.1 hypothetical protein EJK15_07010 [Nonomuraea basaltis]